MSTPPLNPVLKILEPERALLSKGKVRGWHRRHLDDDDLNTARKFVNGCYNHGNIPPGCSILWFDDKVVIRVPQDRGDVFVTLGIPDNKACPPLVPAQNGTEVFSRSKKPTLRRSDIVAAIAVARSQETHDKT